jgi:hypothetical protein
VFLVCKVCLDELSRRLYNVLRVAFHQIVVGFYLYKFFKGGIKTMEQSLFFAGILRSSCWNCIIPILEPWEFYWKTFQFILIPSNQTGP